MMHKSFIDNFEQTLARLHERNFISEINYQEVATGFQQYVLEEQVKREAEKKKREEEQTKEIQKVIKPKKEKKKHSAEQLRERNIGVLLYLGVFLLLLSGLFIATSNWESMQNWMKAGLIFLVSIVFFGFAILTKEVIKIQRTAFAFFVLGSLFLPIVFISISYLQLVGTYLSINGEGKFLMGVFAGVILLPVYLYLAFYLQSKLFKILTLLTLTSTIGFLLAFMKVNEDLFFLAMIVYHFVLILTLLKSGENNWINYFKKDFPAIIQTQLIFITIFMFFIYDQLVLNGFQFLLISVLFFMIMALSKQRNIHFFITLTITLGIYRLLSNELLRDMMPIGFAIFSIVVIWFSYLLKGKVVWGKIWNTTSLVLAIGTFLFSIVFYLASFLEGSIYLLIAYLLLATQFLILTRKISATIITILPAIFLSLTLWHMCLLLHLVKDIHSLLLVLYFIHFLILIFVGLLHKYHYFKEVISSTAMYLLSWVSVITILSATLFIGKWYIPFMILGIISSLVYVYRFMVRKDIIDFLHFIIPAGASCFLLTLVETVPFIYDQGIHLALAIAGIITTISANVYLKWKEKMTKIAFVMGQLIYLLAILMTFSTFYEKNNWVSTSIFLVGIYMLVNFYIKLKQQWIVWLAGVIVTISYLSLIITIWDNGDFLFTILLRYGWIGIFGLAISLRKTIYKYPFLTIAHVYLLISALVTWFMLGSVFYLFFLYCFIAYIVSVIIVLHKHWKLFFQYGSYLWSFLFLAKWISFTFAGGDSYALAFYISSVVLLILYLWKRKMNIVYFFIPFSVIGIGYWIFAFPYNIYTYLIITSYCFTLLLIIYLAKLHLLAIIGVCFILLNNQLWIFHADFLPWESYLLLGIWGIVWWFISRLSYSHFYSWKKEKWFDVYIIGSVISISSLYSIKTSLEWDIIIPGLLLALIIFMQRNRVATRYRWLPIVLSAFVLLQPYYSWLNILTIPAFIHTEMYVIPWIPLLLASKKLIVNYDKFFKVAEWSIVISIAMVLAIDGWISHTIQDAILLGSLAVVSIVSGFYFKYKSYFFTGIGILILNITLQTMPLWGNFPWWVYLLLAGSILILIASMYEMKKQGKKIETLSNLYLKAIKLMKKLKTWR